MAIAIKMPALSPTMEHGKLAKWLVKAGDSVVAGDIMAEIETDKATMEFEAVDEGVITSITITEGTENVPVGTIIAMLEGEGDESAPAAKPAEAPTSPAAAPVAMIEPVITAPIKTGDRVIVSPLAKRLAAELNVDLTKLKGTGPGGRIVKADVEGAASGAAPAAAPALQEPVVAALTPVAVPVTVAAMSDEARAQLDDRIPHSVEKLSGMRKTIARRLTQSMQQAPHIYLSVDVQLDALLKLRGELNEVLAKQSVKLSVNDMLIKALGKALIEVPACNVSFAGNELIRYERADISVAVSIPGGLITPIVQDANGRSLSAIAQSMADLAARAKEGKLLSTEYQGGTASLSNMGMMGIKHFTAVINPPQATILAIGAGEQRPYVMDGALGIATVMTVTGSFDHRAIDGADGARLMAAFRELVEKPLGLVA